MLRIWILLLSFHRHRHHRYHYHIYTHQHRIYTHLHIQAQLQDGIVDMYSTALETCMYVLSYLIVCIGIVLLLLTYFRFLLSSLQSASAHALFDIRSLRIDRVESARVEFDPSQ